mgnify:CR=1 FL=1
MSETPEERFSKRGGRVIASRIADVLSKGKGEAESKTRAAYRDELVAEILTGTIAESYQSEAMTRGVEEERFARAAYELHAGVFVEKQPGRSHPRLRSGASADGEVGADGILEIKCPHSKTHVAWMGAGAVPSEHRPQMLWQLACYPERKWCDFVSFDARMPEGRKLFVVRLERDEAWIGKAEAEVERFLAEVDAMVARFAIEETV